MSWRVRWDELLFGNPTKNFQLENRVYLLYSTFSFPPSREREGRKERGYEVNQVEQKNSACHARACMRGREGERRERGLLWFHCIDLFFHRKRISLYGVVFLQSAWSSACRSGNGMWRQAWSMCMLIPNLMTVCDTRAAVTLGHSL